MSHLTTWQPVHRHGQDEGAALPCELGQKFPELPMRQCQAVQGLSSLTPTINRACRYINFHF